MGSRREETQTVLGSTQRKTALAVNISKESHQEVLTIPHNSLRVGSSSIFSRDCFYPLASQVDALDHLEDS